MSKTSVKGNSSKKGEKKTSNEDKQVSTDDAGPFSAIYDKILLQRGYTLEKELGYGSYATVIKGTWRRKQHKDKPVALKVIDQAKAPKEFREKFLPRELDVHRYIKHENVIRLLDRFIVREKSYLVLELASKGDLLDYVRLTGALTDEEAQFTFRQLCAGMEYLHGLGVAHRDLKCENVLLDGCHNVKITDLGFARWFDSTVLSSTFCGSAAYAAPEILRGKPYRPNRYDLWSMGVILHILVNGTMPFDDSDLRKLVRSQEAKKIRFSSKLKDKMNPEARKLIKALLEPNPDERETIEGCIGSSWLYGVRYLVRSHVPTKESIREPLTRLRLPNPPPEFKASASRPTKIKKRVAMSQREVAPPAELPPGFVASSTRSLRPHNPNTASQTSLRQETIRETMRPVKALVRKPSATLPSEISYYDTTEHLNSEIQHNPYI